MKKEEGPSFPPSFASLSTPLFSEALAISRPFSELAESVPTAEDDDEWNAGLVRVAIIILDGAAF